ncbi:hypothetical protein BDV98DRAFT_574102 [Pterulicium gracile]|uniref:Uncharacterized protein n=1 Tax=Pterulicium gracile TaxID=1884261 RepID=A0A5C3Q7J5_9AGAR|nr:hypothetical protein BDV98DRAFT_574102 [Pterula gracilis]
MCTTGGFEATLTPQSFTSTASRASRHTYYISVILLALRVANLLSSGADPRRLATPNARRPSSTTSAPFATRKAQQMQLIPPSPSTLCSLGLTPRPAQICYGARLRTSA